MTRPLTDEERRLLETIERHTMEGQGQIFIDLAGLAKDLGLEANEENIGRLLDVIAKLCRERGLGYSVMEGGGFRPC